MILREAYEGTSREIMSTMGRGRRGQGPTIVGEM
jgi:hypothetical protein